MDCTSDNDVGSSYHPVFIRPTPFCHLSLVVTAKICHDHFSFHISDTSEEFVHINHNYYIKYMYLL